jgi:hypothetical protein
MRYVLAGLAVAAALSAAFPAQAERRVFVIASDAGGYGVDRCLVNGESCGAAVANAYCRSRDFATAQSFRKIDRDDVTGVVRASGQTCHGSSCEEFVAIECSR